MWAAMKQQGVKKGDMTPEKAADLFAYFVSARYFEKPGDAARGKQAFADRHCADCHGITSSPVAAAPPVVKWESLADPVVLAQQMWNHGPKMRAEFAKKKLAWGKLTGQELTDMLVYLQNLPETRNLAKTFSFPPSDSGEKLFASKGCTECHVGQARPRSAAQESDPDRDRGRHVEPPAQHEESAADFHAGRDAADYLVHLGEAVFPRHGQRDARQDGLRGQELRHVP